ncbi:MAG: prephenate dehydrogenase [Actinomycetota bacterium]
MIGNVDANVSAPFRLACSTSARVSESLPKLGAKSAVSEPARARESRMLIVGVGRVGGALGFDLRSIGFTVDGADTNVGHLATAVSKGAIDAAVDIFQVPDFDIYRVVIIATPPSHVVATAQHVLQHSSNCIVTDVAGVKVSIVEGIADPRFCGGHIMKGGRETGPAAAAPGMCRGAEWVLTAAVDTAPATRLSLIELIEAVGAVPVECDPHDHDDQVSRTSLLPHLLQAALADYVLGKPAAADRLVFGRALDITTELAQVNVPLWVELAETNEFADRTLTEFITALERIRDDITNGDASRVFESGRAARELLDMAKVRRERQAIERVGPDATTAPGEASDHSSSRRGSTEGAVRHV